MPRFVHLKSSLDTIFRIVAKLFFIGLLKTMQNLSACLIIKIAHGV